MNSKKVDEFQKSFDELQIVHKKDRKLFAIIKKWCKIETKYPYHPDVQICQSMVNPMLPFHNGD